MVPWVPKPYTSRNKKAGLFTKADFVYNFAKCTRNEGGRRITRWEHEGLLDEMQERMKRNRAKFGQRRSIVEHPFGTMKCGMQQAGFLMRGLEKVLPSTHSGR